MKEAEKEEAIKLIKEWQEKRPNFSRTRLAQATGVSYPTLLEFDKQGLIECKANGNKPTALQNKHLNNIKKAQGYSMVIDETDIDALELFLKTL